MGQAANGMEDGCAGIRGGCDRDYMYNNLNM